MGGDPRPEAEERPVFVVERYWPGVTTHSVAAAIARLGEAIEAARAPVRHLQCTFLPAEEVVFCLFDGPSPEAVAEVNERAAVPFDRIVPALAMAPRAS